MADFVDGIWAHDLLYTRKGWLLYPVCGNFVSALMLLLNWTQVNYLLAPAVAVVVVIVVVAVVVSR
jgi:hypothetical protein